jgi:hypothetical protein
VSWHHIVSSCIFSTGTLSWKPGKRKQDHPAMNIDMSFSQDSAWNMESDESMTDSKIKALLLQLFEETDMQADKMELLKNVFDEKEALLLLRTSCEERAEESGNRASSIRNIEIAGSIRFFSFQVRYLSPPRVRKH